MPHSVQHDTATGLLSPDSRWTWEAARLPSGRTVDLTLTLMLDIILTMLPDHTISNLPAKSDPPEPLLRIGDLAERTGLTPRAIRYYEELGLLPPAGRTEGDYRLYSPEAVDRLQTIIRFRDLLGFSLAEVGGILRAEETLDELRTQYHASDKPGGRLQRLEEALAVVSGQIDLVERKIELLVQMRSELEAKVTRYRAKMLELSGKAAAGGPEQGDKKD